MATPRGRGERWIARLRARPRPPVVGDFNLSLDGAVQIEAWLSERGGEPRRIGLHLADEPTTRPPAVRLEPDGDYEVIAWALEDAGGDVAAVGWRMPDRTDEVPLPASRCRGRAVPERGLQREVWRGMPGNRIDDLLASPRLGQPPDDVAWLPDASAGDDGEMFGARVSGLLMPPVDGLYRFVMSAQDDARLALDLGEAEMTTIVPHCDAEHVPRGNEVRLTAGKARRIVIHHKQSGGAALLRLGWIRPDGVTQDVIPGEFLRPAP